VAMLTILNPGFAAESSEICLVGNCYSFMLSGGTWLSEISYLVKEVGSGNTLAEFALDPNRVNGD